MLERAVIGSRVVLEYSDHDGAMGAVLPRTGTVTSEIADPGGVAKWYVLTLDQPFELQERLQVPNSYALRTYAELLIRFHWVDTALSETPVSVWVARGAEAIDPQRMDPEALCWGMAHVLAT
jgi:hypothetical protein